MSFTYERFTDRARKVMQLANQSALQLNHEYIGTEHVLLGLVKEGSGVAGTVLKNFGVDLAKVQAELAKVLVPGPDVVTMGRLPQTPRVKEALEYAAEEAKALNHSYVGTEHMLLGLLRETKGVASQILVAMGLKIEDVRKEVLDLLGCGKASKDKEEGFSTESVLMTLLSSMVRKIVREELAAWTAEQAAGKPPNERTA